MLNIFLLLGQSNMAGRGVLADVAPIENPNILVYREHRWSQAVEPLHDDRPTAGIGLAMSFAQTLLERYPSARIGLLPAAVGSSPLSRWQEGGDLYQRAVAAAREAAKGGVIRGLLWHQGENDSQSEADASSYLERFAKSAAALRRELAIADAPVVVGELGAYLKNKGGYDFFETVNGCLRSAGDVVPKCGTASAAGLTHKGDHLHFDAVSLREFGRRYAAAYLEIAGPGNALVQ